MDPCLGHVLESTKELEMKLGLYIDSIEGKGKCNNNDNLILYNDRVIYP